MLVKAVPSSRTSKVPPGSVERNVKVADVEAVGLDGCDKRIVSGGVVSPPDVLTVHVYVAGVGSVFPAASVARTWNVCDPFESPV